MDWLHEGVAVLLAFLLDESVGCLEDDGAVSRLVKENPYLYGRAYAA